MEVPSQQGYHKVIIEWNKFNYYWVREEENVLDALQKKVDEITREDVVRTIARAYCNPYWESELVIMQEAEGDSIGKST